MKTMHRLHGVAGDKICLGWQLIVIMDSLLSSIAAATNYYQFSALKQYKIIG